MIATRAMANDVAAWFAGAGGHLDDECVYKPLMIFNITQSITLTMTAHNNFASFLVEGAQPNLKKSTKMLNVPRMLVTALRRTMVTTRPRKSPISRRSTI